MNAPRHQRLPFLPNFVPDYKTWPSHKSHWQCMRCGKPGITDRVLHNSAEGCRPLAWLDPLGVMVETVFALWGPDAEPLGKVTLPEIPAAKTIKRADLPYFTKDPATDAWMVIGYEEFMDPGSVVMVNRKKDTQQPVVVDTWCYRRKSFINNTTYVMATFKRIGEI